MSTTLGEIYQFEVVDPHRSLMELRSILDWKIAPRLKEVTGRGRGQQLRRTTQDLRSPVTAQIRSSLTRSPWLTCFMHWRRTI